MAGLDDFLRQSGINPRIKRAYERLFDTTDSEDAKIVLEDLKCRYKYYQSSGTSDPNRLVREACERDVVCYIIGLAKRVNEDNLDFFSRTLADEDARILGSNKGDS